MTKKAILCVDDEKTVLSSIKTQLRRQFPQYLCEIAEGVDEAWEIIEELEEDEIDLLLIVSDWLMPGMKGDEFLIQVHQKFPEVVKVLLTGQADPEAVERVEQEANLHCCLHKPWTEEELVKTVATGLE